MNWGTPFASLRNPAGVSASLPISWLLCHHVARISTQTTTLIATSTREVSAGLPVRSPPYGVRAVLVPRDPSRTHDGHWNPTEAGCMQSGQIGRSQRWHRMWASRSVCR
jgi:hypothetical protein